MPAVPFDPARARPRGQARPPKMPATADIGADAARAGTPAGAALPPGAVRQRRRRPRRGAPHARAPGTPGVGAGTRHGAVHGRAAARCCVAVSSEPAGGVMMPAHVPLSDAAPRHQSLARSRHPGPRHAGPRRRVVGDGGHHADRDRGTPGGLPTEAPRRDRPSHQLAGLGAVAVPRASSWRPSSRIERVVRPEAGPAWATLALAAAACGAMQVVGRRSRLDLDAGDPCRPDRRGDMSLSLAFRAVPRRPVQGGARADCRRRVRRPARRPRTVRDARPGCGRRRHGHPGAASTRC